MNRLTPRPGDANNSRRLLSGCKLGIGSLSQACTMFELAIEAGRKCSCVLQAEAQ